MRARTLLDLTVDALAAYRLARFVVQEDAPAAVAIRDAVEARVPTRWAAALDCQHCTGMWAAIGLGALRLLPGSQVLVWPLAVAGAQSVLSTLAETLEEVPQEPQGPVYASGNVGPVETWETGTPTPPPASSGDRERGGIVRLEPRE